MKKKAFTLLELIISLAIVSIIVLIISSMLGLNFKVSSKIYKSDHAYKEATNSMLYIENVLRQAEKVEKIEDPRCNLQAHLDGSRYRFDFDEESKKLKVIINGSNGKGTNWIGSINDVILTYDGEEEVLLWIEGLDGEIYQTKINLGPRP